MSNELQDRLQKNQLPRWKQWVLMHKKGHTSKAIELSNPTVFILLWDDLKKKDKNPVGYESEERGHVQCVYMVGNNKKRCFVWVHLCVSHDSQWWCHSSWSPVHRHRVAQSPAKPLPVSFGCETPRESFHDLAGGSPWSSQGSGPREKRWEKSGQSGWRYLYWMLWSDDSVIINVRLNH